MENKKEKRDKAILEELQLLEKMTKEHEWAVFGQKEAEEEETTEAKIDSEINGSSEESA